MSKVFRPSTRESSILSKIESSKEHARRLALQGIKDCLEPLSNAISMKLVEEKLVETKSKNSLEEQLSLCLEKLSREEDFDIDFATAMITSVRLVTANPVPMIAWCATIGILTTLSIASVFVGLLVVMPVIGHTTWHLYRRAVVAGEAEERAVTEKTAKPTKKMPV